MKQIVVGTANRCSPAILAPGPGGSPGVGPVGLGHGCESEDSEFPVPAERQSQLQILQGRERREESCWPCGKEQQGCLPSKIVASRFGRRAPRVARVGREERALNKLDRQYCGVRRAGFAEPVDSRESADSSASFGSLAVLEVELSHRGDCAAWMSDQQRARNKDNRKCIKKKIEKKA